MIRRPPRSTQSRSSAASDVYKRQVATPSTDPFSMIMLAVPMTLLFLVSEIVARTVDRRRARKRAAGDLSNLSDDEASPLDSESDSSDYRRSDLDEGDD